MSAHTSTGPQFLTVSEAATALGVSAPTIRRWVAEQRLAAVQVGGARGSLRVPVAELERLIVAARAAQ